MVASFLALGPWAWVIVGLVLLALEVLAPGAIFLWLGVSAIVVGLLEFVFDMSWQAEVIVFGVLSLVSVIAYRMYMRGRTNATDRPFLNRRISGLIGRTYQLHQAIDHGEGRIRVNDTLWRVRGPDLPQGTSVKVVSSDGAVLIVEAADGE